jgi:hypothetical protein
MVALVSLHYGCLAKPGTFVSATDRLLHDVATFYGMIRILVCATPLLTLWV